MNEKKILFVSTDRLQSIFVSVFFRFVRSVGSFLNRKNLTEEKEMAPRFFQNPFPDYKEGKPVSVPNEEVIKLIQHYVGMILENTKKPSYRERRGDLYVGNSGIAFMFYKMSRSKSASQFPKAMKFAKEYIDEAKSRARQHDSQEADRVSFLCGNAGIYAVSAAINEASGNKDGVNRDIENYSNGIPVCKNLIFNEYGNDEILFGRAGFLSGMFWLNTVINPSPFNDDHIMSVVTPMYDSGLRYSNQRQLAIPLMYVCYGDDYLGAAHGVSAILHMLLESDLSNSEKHLPVIKQAIEYFYNLQAEDGNFPASLDEVGDQYTHYPLVHWCHGAPGVVYMLAKAFIKFKSEKYLDACEACAELVWRKGLLLKGPGLCHGIAGNGYVFLLLYRLTKKQKFLYRAIKFFDFLKHPDFIKHARTPDRPFSLYEGLSGTVCFLLDLMEPEKAAFPFMDVFEGQPTT